MLIVEDEAVDLFSEVKVQVHARGVHDHQPTNNAAHLKIVLLEGFHLEEGL